MIDKIKIQHKVTPQIYQHTMYNVSDIVLVTDKGEEMLLSELLEKVLLLLEENKRPTRLESSGAV